MSSVVSQSLQHMCSSPSGGWSLHCKDKYNSNRSPLICYLIILLLFYFSIADFLFFLCSLYLVFRYYVAKGLFPQSILFSIVHASCTLIGIFLFLFKIFFCDLLNIFSAPLNQYSSSVPLIQFFSFLNVPDFQNVLSQRTFRSNVILTHVSMFSVPEVLSPISIMWVKLTSVVVSIQAIPLVDSRGPNN